MGHESEATTLQAGAEIVGADLAAPVAADLAHDIRQALCDDSIAIWDNAAAHHYAVPGQIGFRHMERIRTTGTEPFGLVL